MNVTFLCLFSFFFFKQKTAYEMRISDWSSDVCSSDLRRFEQADQPQHDGIEMLVHHLRAPFRGVGDLGAPCGIILPPFAAFYIELEIGIADSVERAFNGRLAAGRLVVIVERLPPELGRA